MTLTKVLNSILEGEHTAIISKVKSIISTPEFAYQNPYDYHSFRETVLKWCNILAEEGIGNIAYPKENGGEADMHKYFVAMETLSYHDLSLVIKFGVQFGLWGMSVYLLGTEKHHNKYLKDIGALELPGSFAMTETGHGSNVRGIETTATYNHQSQSFIIHTPNDNARKDYIGNAACHAQAATVFAKLIIDDIDHGICAFVVSLRDKQGNILPGIRIEDCGMKMGLNGVDNGRIWFNKVEIPKDNLLDRFVQIDTEGKFQTDIENEGKRFFTMLGTLVGGRIGIPKSALSASKSGLTIALKYGSYRRQFGPKDEPEKLILDYQSYQKRLFPLLAKSYALHFALEKLAATYAGDTKGEKMRKVEALAAGLKAYTTWHATHTLQECREACGGKGFLSENRIGILKNDSDIYTTFEGDNTVLLQLVAKSRLTDYQESFTNFDFSDVMNYIINEARISIDKLNPVNVRNTDEEHLLDVSFLREALLYREQVILKTAAQRIRQSLKNGEESFETFNKCQNHLMNVGESYIERIVLDNFIEVLETITTANKAYPVLLKLCQLYALDSINRNRSWFLEYNYMEGAKTKAIRRLTEKLCVDLRPDIIELVDAFEIPDVCLAAPIASQKNSEQ